MQSATFRKWLAERGCRFDHHEHKRGEGHVLVTVHHEGRKSEVSLASRAKTSIPETCGVLARNSDSIGLTCLTSEPGVSASPLDSSGSPLFR